MALLGAKKLSGGAKMSPASFSVGDRASDASTRVDIKSYMYRFSGFSCGCQRFGDGPSDKHTTFVFSVHKCWCQ